MYSPKWAACCALASILAMPMASIPACAPAFRNGQPAVNADQTVIVIWDAATQTQHFIRKASFKSEAEDFGFLVPTPSQPELAETSEEAFVHLQRVTAPKVEKRWRSRNIGCCADCRPRGGAWGPAGNVQVCDRRSVAGFDAAVLEATTADALTDWLKRNGYAFSPEIEQWAEPYIAAGWFITALKVDKNLSPQQSDVHAQCLRLSFKTERPVFTYREPNPAPAAQQLGVVHRMLRIYFIAEAHYRGELTKEESWSGKVVWSNKVSADDRTAVLNALRLPNGGGPAEWWLTEFEDRWPYRSAPADLYFERDPVQSIVIRPPVVQFVESLVPQDATVYAFAMVAFVSFVVRRFVNIGRRPRE